jgi:hypothetical protein
VSPGGTLIWDVARLVALAEGLPVRKMPLTEIAEFDEAYWFPQGAAVSCRQVAEHAQLIQEADLSFPIIVSTNGRLMDGMHRVAKAHLQGLSEIDAVQLTLDPEPDYVDKAPDELPY